LLILDHHDNNFHATKLLPKRNNLVVSREPHNDHLLLDIFSPAAAARSDDGVEIVPPFDEAAMELRHDDHRSSLLIKNITDLNQTTSAADVTDNGTSRIQSQTSLEPIPLPPLSTESPIKRTEVSLVSSELAPLSHSTRPLSSAEFLCHSPNESPTFIRHKIISNEQHDVMPSFIRKMGSLEACADICRQNVEPFEGTYASRAHLYMYICILYYYKL
jgi:hypothetical protein